MARIGILGQIQEEAESRIANGIVLDGGVRFRAADDSRQRLRELVEALEDGVTSAVSFRTSGGVTMTLDDPASARSILTKALLYTASVLETSATLQDAAIARTLPVDWRNDEHWPDPAA